MQLFEMMLGCKKINIFCHMPQPIQATLLTSMAHGYKTRHLRSNLHMFVTVG
jgi:hypothetical protein